MATLNSEKIQTSRPGHRAHQPRTITPLPITELNRTSIRSLTFVESLARSRVLPISPKSLRILHELRRSLAWPKRLGYRGGCKIIHICSAETKVGGSKQVLV